MQDLTPKFPVLASEEEIILPESFGEGPMGDVVGGWQAGSGQLSQGKIALQAANERILIGDATAPLTGTGIFMGSDGAATVGYDFRAGNPSGNYIHWDASAATLTIVGALTATSGTIGGWTIGADYIRDTAGVVGLSSAVTGADDIRFWAGDATPANAEFRVTESGALTASNATITGTITATAGAIGGFTIGTDYLRDAADTFGLASTVSGSDDVRFWAGASFANRATAPFRVTEAGAVTGSNFAHTGGSVAGVPISSIPNNSSTDISLLDLTHDLAFTVTDLNTVAWASGTITMSNGRTFSITGSNTGNMAARTYIYLDTAVSSTALQTTTTVSTAMGANKKLIAVARNETAEASFTVYGGIGGIKLPESATSVSNNNWVYSGTWSVTDLNTIAWGSGTLTLSNGNSYSITGSNTGNMAAKTYIYFALGTSSTAFQTTTTASTAIGPGKILIAIAQNGATEATYQVMNDQSSNIDAANIVAGSITANEIAAGTITAVKLDVSELSAITADLGNITAGTITGGIIRTSAVDPYFYMDSTAFFGVNAAGDIVFEVVIDGANVGDVTMGDVSSGSYAQWDNSAATFNVYADNVPTTTQGFFGGDGSDGALTITSGTTTVSAGSAATLVKNYTSISITSTGKLAFSNPHTNGTTIILKSQGNVTLTSTAPCISTVGMGAAGGAAVTSGGTTGDGLPGTDGKSFSFYITNNGVNGTGGSGAGAGGAIASFEAVKVNDALGKYMNVIPGAGGGSAGNNGTSGGSPQRTGGAGGRGGGALVIECGGALNFTIAGGITVAGSDGGDGVLTSGAPADWAAGGGGGGGGGVCIVLYNALTAASGTITVSGGTGGDTGSDGVSEAGGGGGGAVEDAGNTGSAASSGQTGGNGGDGSSLIARNTLFA